MTTAALPRPSPRPPASPASTACRTCSGLGVVEGFDETFPCPTCRPQENPTMLSEKAVREHRDALKVIRNLPCNCTAAGHSAKCEEGGRMMDASIGVLSWALGENEGSQRLIDHINEAAAEARSILSERTDR